MKKFLLAILSCGFISGATAQINLYVSVQTGQYTSYDGSQGKTTDKHESGTVTLSATGPVKYTVDPPAITIGPNQTKNWTGKVFPDVNNAPAPGTSANGTITANYDVTYSRAQGAGVGGTVVSTYNCHGGGCHAHGDNDGVHEIVNKTGTQNVNFTVYSVKVTAIDKITTCEDVVKIIPAEGYPAGGTYSWTAGPDITITAGANTAEVSFKSTKVGQSKLTVTYTVSGVKYAQDVTVDCAKPEVTFDKPDVIDGAAVDKQFTITPKVVPTGSVEWSVEAGLHLNSGPYNFVAFITPKQPGNYKVTAKVTVCKKVVTKEFLVKVNPCMVYAPDEVKVLKGKTVDITANGNMQGTYAWTAGGKAQVEGAANQQTVKIKGTDAGDGWAEVTFTGNTGCTDKKKVKVVVLDKPTLKVDVAYAPINPICLKGTRILSAKAEPAGGSYEWTLSSNSLKFYGQAGNTPNVVVEAAAGGPCTVTCKYTVDGQSVSVDLTTDVKAYSKIEVTASNAATELAPGTKVTYTAKAYDHNGQPTAAPAFSWRVVYIPIGQENNVGNWYSYDLQGNGATMDYTWSFPQGNYPLVGNSPYKMTAWIQAAEYCTYKSGSVHIKVVSKNGKN